MKFNFYSINHALVNTPAIFYNGIQITTSKIKLIGKQKFLFQIYHNQAEQERVGLKVIKNTTSICFKCRKVPVHLILIDLSAARQKIFDSKASSYIVLPKLDNFRFHLYKMLSISRTPIWSSFICLQALTARIFFLPVKCWCIPITAFYVSTGASDITFAARQTRELMECTNYDAFFLSPVEDSLESILSISFCSISSFVQWKLG